MPHQSAHVVAARLRRDIYGRAGAGLPRNAAGAVSAEPIAPDYELGQRVRQLCNQRKSDRGRQIFHHQHLFADCREMAVPLDDAAVRNRLKSGGCVCGQLECSGGGPDFGNRCTDRCGKLGAPCNRALHLGIASGDNVNEISVDQKRRIFENGSRDRGLVDRQRLYNDGRRIGAACEHIGHGLTYKRRGIVKQPQESALGGGAIIIRQIGNQPGPRQRSRCLCSPGGRSGSYPTDELPNDHGPAD